MSTDKNTPIDMTEIENQLARQFMSEGDDYTTAHQRALSIVQHPTTRQEPAAVDPIVRRANELQAEGMEYGASYSKALNEYRTGLIH